MENFTIEELENKILPLGYKCKKDDDEEVDDDVIYRSYDSDKPNQEDYWISVEFDSKNESILKLVFMTFLPLCQDGDYDCNNIIIPEEDYHDLDKYFKFMDNSLKFEYEVFITGKHLENLKWAKENLNLVMESFDFKLRDSSLMNPHFCEDENVGLYIEYHHPNVESCSITFYTDYITGNLKFWTHRKIEDVEDLKKMSQMDLRMFIMSSALTNDKGDVREVFEYLFSNDPKFTIDTYDEVWKIVTANSLEDLEKIDLNIIPDKYRHKYDKALEMFNHPKKTEQ